MWEMLREFDHDCTKFCKIMENRNCGNVKSGFYSIGMHIWCNILEDLNPH